MSKQHDAKHKIWFGRSLECMEARSRQWFRSRSASFESPIFAPQGTVKSAASSPTPQGTATSPCMLELHNVRFYMFCLTVS